jgi:hypothetical protein
MKMEIYELLSEMAWDDLISLSVEQSIKYLVTHNNLDVKNHEELVYQINMAIYDQLEAKAKEEEEEEE